MNKIVKGILVVLALSVVSAGALAFWQRDNLKAVYDSQKYSSEELLQQIDSSKEEMKKELEEKYPALKVQDISAEDEAKILKGEITLEEVAQKYNLPLEAILDLNSVQGSVSSETNQQSTSPDASSTNVASADTSQFGGAKVSSGSSSSGGAQTGEDKVIGDHIGRMYGLKAKYLSKLGALESQAIAEYKRSGGKASKKEIGYKYARIGASYEGSCDAEVESILSSLESELSAMGADTSIVRKLRSSYYQEKRAKKAYYISQFQ